jgi:hypothetical protein
MMMLVVAELVDPWVPVDAMIPWVIGPDGSEEGIRHATLRVRVPPTGMLSWLLPLSRL